LSSSFDCYKGLIEVTSLISKEGAAGTEDSAIIPYITDKVSA